MKSWTNDIDGLCVALRLTKSRREAIKLIVDWRAPAPPPPAPAAPKGPTSEPEPCLPPAVGARMVLDALESPVKSRRARP